VPWRGLTHDLSKFRPSEFLPFARYHYGPSLLKDSPEAIARFQAFQRAWHWHIARNRHHWEHWVVSRDGRSGTVARALGTYVIPGVPIGVEQPDMASVREMLADWLAMAPTHVVDTDPLEHARTFYLTHRDQMILSPPTRAFIESELAIPQVRETGWRAPEDVIASQLAPARALAPNEPVVVPGGRRGIFRGYRRGRALVQLEHGALLAFHEKDLQRAHT